jgi:hypothetical protein
MFTARCHVADWCSRLVEVWPWPPLSSSFTEAVTTITVCNSCPVYSHNPWVVAVYNLPNKRQDRWKRSESIC